MKIHTRHLLTLVQRQLVMHDGCVAESNRVLACLVVHYGRYLALEQKEIKLLWLASYLHDWGHLTIPTSVMRKRGEFTLEENLLVQGHPAQSEYYCKAIPDLKDVLPLVRWHHEKFNGEGYPDKLSGSKIPILVQHFQMCDLYVSMTTTRHQRKSLSPERAQRILTQETQNNWRNPQVTKLFFGFLEFCESNPVPEMRSDAEIVP